MTINFTKAIVDVRKLKSHAKVGYQDHPLGDRQCSGCSMFIPGNPPACTHVAPPIQASGYCTDWEALDPNARARAAIGKRRSFADVLKDGPPDEARDAQGKWTSGGGGGAKGKQAAPPQRLGFSSNARNPARMSHGNIRAYVPGAELAPAKTEEAQRASNEKQLRDAQKQVADLQQQLSQHSQDKSEDLYWGIHRQYQQALDDLRALHDRIFGKRMRKDLTVGDVHTATALGNQDKKKRRKDFLTTIAEVKGGAKVVQVASDFSGALEKIKSDAIAGAVDFSSALAKIGNSPTNELLMPKRQVSAKLAAADHVTVDAHPDYVGGGLLHKRTVSALFMRHGPTRFNDQTDMSKDRVRSWNNVPLTAEGIEDAEKAGEKLKDEGIGYIVSSDLGRAVQTSKIVGKAVGVKPVHEYDMRPWNLGKFTGMYSDEAHDGILHHVENPDEEVEGGESFNKFKHRAITGMLSHIKKAGGKKMLVVSHHRNERLFAAMNPDGSVNGKKFMKTGEDPGDFTEMEFDTDALQKALPDAKVGKIWDSNDQLPDGVKSSLPDHAQTVFRRVVNDRIHAGQSEVSAIRQAWTAVKNGWRKEGDAWVRKVWLGVDNIDEFIESHLFKLGGEMSHIERPTEGVNASLQLTAIDHQSARSPFPYDQYFFTNLRDDQKERVLAALTDQDSLSERTIPLSALSSVQDRVDPLKIQSMLEGEPEKLAVVVRTGPGRYGIADGHHRLTAALLSGVKTVPVKYLDVERYDPQVVTDDNPGSKGEPMDKAIDFASALSGRAAGTMQNMEIEFDVHKTDDDQQLVFGWASVSSIDGQDVVDKQDDIIPEDELEKAAYDFALYCRKQGDMHDRVGVGRLIESMVFTTQKQEALGIDLGMVGWWIGFRVDDPGVWKRIKNGDLPEFSIGGKARREIA